MKKIRLLVLLCVVLCAALFGTISCGPYDSERDETGIRLSYAVAFADGYDETTMPFDIAYQSGDDYFSQENALAILKSKDELLSLCREKKYPFFDEKNENFDRKLSRTMRSYSEDYFNDKSLIFILLNENRVFLPKIEKIKVEDGILTVFISNPTGNREESAEKNTFVYIIETEKSSLENVNGVITEKTDKGTADEYEKINFYSEFYSLEYAYNRNLVTKNDIRSIGYYQNLGKEWQGKDGSEQVKSLEDFVATEYQPVEKAPNELSAETIEKIKTSYAELLNDSLKYFYEQKGKTIKKDFLTVNDIYEVKYFGTYNGYIAVAVPSKMSLQQVTTPTIADTVFYYADSGAIIFLFRDGE